MERESVDRAEKTVEPTASRFIEMREVLDPIELANARAQDERFERNWSWFEARAQTIYSQFRGKCLCVAGQELFVADTVEEVLAQAKAAHPDDDGRLIRYIPKEKAHRIYANRRTLVLVRRRDDSARDPG